MSSDPTPLRRADPGESPDPASFSYSVVIPVFNSVGVVATTIDRVIEVFEDAGCATRSCWSTTAAATAAGT